MMLMIYRYAEEKKRLYTHTIGYNLKQKTASRHIYECISPNYCLNSSPKTRWLNFVGKI